MDPEMRRAWTEIMTPEDYDAHMATIGQAQAAAELTVQLIEAADLNAGSRVIIAGAGTGQVGAERLAHSTRNQQMNQPTLMILDRLVVVRGNPSLPRGVDLRSSIGETVAEG